MPIRMTVTTGIFGLLLAVLTTESAAFARPDDDSPALANQEESVTLRVWWPDTLLSQSAGPTLETQFNSFRSAYVNVNLDVRYHEYHPIDTLHRLALTRDVAPDALPDLILIHYDEISAAITSGLLYPIEGLLPTSVLNDLAINVLAMGQSGGELYGLPYLLAINHMIAVGIATPPPHSFAEFLDQNTPLLFAATPADNQTINDLLLIQYLAAGGYLVDQQNNPALSDDAMRTVLDFFDAVIENQTLETALVYQDSSDFRPQLLENRPVLALIDSTDYLRDRDFLPQDIEILSPLTPAGEPFTLLEGWTWVLLTNDATRQIQARNFLAWMMNSDNLTDTALALNMLPSQERALRVIAEDRDLIVLSDLVGAAYFLPPEQRQNAATVALQAAFESVLRGTPPDEATETALSSLEN